MTQTDPLIIALKALVKRDYLVAELRSLLVQKGYSDEQADGALDQISRWGFLDEPRHATQIALSRRRRYGRERILAELEAKGATGEAIQAVMELLPEENEFERARALVAEKGLARSDRVKAARFLATRGFSQDVIESIIESNFDEVDDQC